MKVIYYYKLIIKGKIQLPKLILDQVSTKKWKQSKKMEKYLFQNSEAQVAQQLTLLNPNDFLNSKVIYSVKFKNKVLV
jgi:hypothetical protein